MRKGKKNQYALKEYLQAILPDCCIKLCCCLSVSKKDRFFIKARKQLQQELCLVTLIRNVRFFKAAIATQINPRQVQ